MLRRQAGLWGLGSARAWPFSPQILEQGKQVQGISRGREETAMGGEALGGFLLGMHRQTGQHHQWNRLARAHRFANAKRIRRLGGLNVPAGEGSPLQQPLTGGPQGRTSRAKVTRHAWRQPPLRAQPRRGLVPQARSHWPAWRRLEGGRHRQTGLARAGDAAAQAGMSCACMSARGRVQPWRQHVLP
jgi:hypothetical protein